MSSSELNSETIIDGTKDSSDGQKSTTCSISSLQKTKPCTRGSKNISASEYGGHMNTHHNQSSSQQSTTHYNRHICFSCASPLSPDSTLSHIMPCQSHHKFCVNCIHNLMAEHIKLKTAPCCCVNICDQQLPKYDVSCLPLEPDMIAHLLELVTTEECPQCPQCLFYIKFETLRKFEGHVTYCRPDDMVPCEYCCCLYRSRQLDEHSRYCRNISEQQRQQAFIDFIVSKLKYPFTPAQVRHYIERKNRNRQALDLHKIVDDLANFGSTFPYKVPTFNCGVCLESYPYQDIFVFGCKDSHKLCYGCFEESCTVKMNSGEILKCALCDYQLEHGEINQLRVAREQKKKFHEHQIEKTFSNFINNARGIIKCPNRECKWVVEARHPNAQFRVVCHACANEFCSICNQQYHYRTTCQEVTQTTQQWFVWCTTERGNYWRVRAQQDASYRAQLDDYERQKVANNRRNEELRRRYNDLKADEEFKAQNCRLCPHCKRVVQHMGGCSSMICGQNFHGGDQQSGCGQTFNWDNAQRYVPIISAGPEQNKNDLPRIENKHKVVHEGIRCNGCHKDVEGIRFDCIHCPSLTYCEKCEQRCTLTHSEELRKHNQQQHVFRLITTPERYRRKRQ
ncbi:unnamed protein product [Rotaria socialis]|uniref:RING-type domain-containing protein n=1 Tax=Rotaria socialis TaxID=392032 RepID=A0A817YSS9_9BILA|nr:unnamed protein product [Rotaria socialis]CAF3732276.1 unnamed protein product [Rotaria socialis]CAF4228165.1 unnamed protein product [Rotaria socialis]CAF4524466.1 unnamed protein product [Rotaria socialis]